MGNIVIAAGGSALIAKVKSRTVGATVFVASLAIISVRGYLVPGTPKLTKRYLPERVLRWFDHEPSFTAGDTAVTIDPEQVLLGANAVAPCQNGTDLCLTTGFRTSWRERIDAHDGRNPGKSGLRGVLDAPHEPISFDEYGDALVATTDAGVIGQWTSPAAITADVAAAGELAQRLPDWSDLNPVEKARVLTSLRIFLETCPQCGGVVRVEQAVVESCCRSSDVVVSACQDCDVQLLEVEWEDEGAPIESDGQASQPA